MGRKATVISGDEKSPVRLDYPAIGVQIRSYRKKQKMTQKTLAEKSGISVQHLSHIECGSTKLSLPALVGLAEALSVDINTLLNRNSSLARLVLDNELAAILRDASADDMELCTNVCQTLLATRNKQRR